MMIFVFNNEIVGYIPSNNLTEERKAEILAENPHAVWTDEEFNYPDPTKQYKTYYIDGTIVYEEYEESEPTPTQEERLSAAEDNISMLTDYSADLLYQVCLLQLGASEEDL